MRQSKLCGYNMDVAAPSYCADAGIWAPQGGAATTREYKPTAGGW